jgi:hypothetical protein
VTVVGSDVVLPGHTAARETDRPRRDMLVPQRSFDRVVIFVHVDSASECDETAARTPASGPLNVDDSAVRFHE